MTIRWMAACPDGVRRRRPSRSRPGAWGAVALAAVLVAVVMLAGCGADAGENDAGNSTVTGAAGSAAPGVTGAPAGAGVGGAPGDAPVPAQLEFTAATTDGGELSGASLAGRPAMLWFWAPWCTICRGEAPEIARAHERFGDQVEFVGVAGLGRVDAMREFVDDTGLGMFPHLVDDDGSLWARFGVAAQPAFAFITADGDVEIRPRISEDRLTSQLESLVATA